MILEMNKSYQKSTQKNSIYITASLVIQFLFKKNLNLRYLCLAFGKIQHIWLKNQIQCTYIYILYCTVASAATVTSLVFLRRFRYFRDIVATGNCWIKHSSQSTFSQSCISIRRCSAKDTLHNIDYTDTLSV